jgi:6,7-dimethyl-8-ribityllumazine synthase
LRNHAENTPDKPIPVRLCYSGSTLSRDITKPDLDGSALRIAVVVARFNEHITSRLLEGALKAAESCRVKAHTVDWVPGAFELPVVAQKLAKSGHFDAVVCLGCVVRHETDHYRYIAGEAASGIQRASLDTGVPCIFGVLTCDTEEQALDRSGGEQGNKGADAMQTAVETANLLRSL